MALSIYITMTIIGVLTKVWAFSVLKKHWENKTLHHITFAFLCALLLQSFFEMYGYYFSYTNDPLGAHRGMIGYYICTFIFISLIPFISLQLTRLPTRKAIIYSIIAFNSFVVLNLLFTDQIISGARQLGVNFTAIKGPLYWIFQTSVLASILFTFYILSRKNVNSFISIRSKNILISFFPFAVFVLFLIVAMQLGIKINAIGILPICISIFVAAITHNICHKHIVDYSYWVPFSKKRRRVNQLIKPFIEIQTDGLDPELKKKYNKLITQHALELFNGNQTKAAEWLKVSQSWVSRNNRND